MFRDIEHLVVTVLLPWFILTPIFYTFDQLPGHQLASDDRQRSVLRQPRCALCGGDSRPAFWGKLPELGDVIYVVGVKTAALVIASLVFRRVDDQFAAQL